MYTQTTSSLQLELEIFLGKALIEANACSGEYAPALSKKLHYPCSVLVEINNSARASELLLVIVKPNKNH